MIKKSFFVLTAAVAMLFASCEKYDHAISDIEDRLDKIENASLTTIDQQITAINASINDLKAVDTELNGYISALQTTAANLQSQIDATNTALSALESDLEGQITASEQKVLDELNAVKTALEGQLATINNTIASLQAKDAELDKKIADLQKYVDGEIKTTKDWARATFSTLEQYEATQTAISEINALIKSTQESITALEEKLGKKIADDIAAAVAGVNADIAAKVTEITDAYTAAIQTAKDDITAAYTDAIKTAITASEISMKDWVNGVLAEGYYKKAEIDGKITALATQVTEGDEALQKEIDALTATLAKAESDLTAAYTKAIEDAITNNNGKITAEIAAAVKIAQDNLQAQIDDINEEIDDIKDRLAALEGKVEDLIDRIQTIRFLPEYSDGKVELTSDNAPVTLTFLLSPNEAAQAIATAYVSNKSVVSAYLSLTQPRTRAVGTPTQINVTEVTGTADGVLTVEVNAENLPADYWATAENANIFIHISDGNNDVISEMIPTFYTVICELPDGYDFRTAVHAQLADDTKAIKFIANSKVVTEHQIGTSPAYMQLNGTTLEIHTAAKEFIFNEDCAIMFSGFNNSSYTKFENITTIDFNGCINTSKVTEMGRMFYGCKSLNSLDLSSFNTAKVTNMLQMFNGCEALNSLDLSSFNTAKVTNMGDMFFQCYALNSLDLSSFNTANVTNMGDMFYSCQALKSLDLSSFNTAKVTTMGFMFFNCLALESLNLSSFNTAKVTTMGFMFANCAALESLNLSSFNTANVTTMRSMFNQCQTLKSLDLSSFNTANVADMSSMFYSCKALESLNLSSFKTANVTNMSSMFYQCYALNSLDLSNFNTANVTRMDYMFSHCRSLNLLDIQNFDMGKVTDSSSMCGNVGMSYYNATGNRTPIKVTMALKSVLDNMNVSTGNYAEYWIVDNLPG